MSDPGWQLERHREQLLEPDERTRVVSEAQPVGAVSIGGRSVTGRVVLALTDRRLLVLRRRVLLGRHRSVAQWPAAAIRISVTRRRVGGSVVTVITAEGEEHAFEWLGGDHVHDWATYLFHD